MSAPNGRALAIGTEAHAVYRALVDRLLAVGTLPDDGTLALTSGLGAVRARAALAALVAGDWAGRDAAGAIVALYPFSLVPTPVRVRFGGAERFAMCAIDALGIAPMLDREVAIASSCPCCGAAIGLTVGPDGVRACLPGTARVVYRRAAGPAHLSRCGATRFFCSPEDGRAWLMASGGPEDVLLAPDEAFARGRAIFAGWYRAGPRAVEGQDTRASPPSGGEPTGKAEAERGEVLAGPRASLQVPGRQWLPLCIHVEDRSRADRPNV